MIPIYKPCMPDNLMPEFFEILYSGQLSYGKYGKLFESTLKEYIGCEYIMTISSYNTAMQVVLSTLGLQFGDEVIASPVSCLASNQPFATKGLKVVWADIDPSTGTLCPKDVESKITNNTKAIMIVHIYGLTVDINPVIELAKKYSADHVWLNKITNWNTFANFEEKNIMNPAHAKHQEYKDVLNAVRAKIKTYPKKFIEIPTLDNQ